MNILIPNSWLKEFLKTKASPQEIAKYLSLCSQSVEKVQKVNSDSIYNIEITTNRPDCLSIIGIARELSAILPRFGLSARLVQKNYSQISLPKGQKSSPLKVQIKNPSLCPRFSAIILDDAQIKPSPKIVKDRLEKVCIRAINSVVDISNYLMMETGQPIHTFDYDKINAATMILRESHPGEKITTLDGITRTLPGGDIVIEDGSGRLIDLCGIMGGQNSEITPQTKRVLLFVQAYDPVRIRRTCMSLAHRTEAATRFEKGVDTENVIPVLWQGVNIIQKNANAHLASNLIDIYPNPYRPKKVALDFEFANKRIGLKIPPPEIKKILTSLGFEISFTEKNLFATIPSHRAQDISIPEDLIEEIARIYGYHNLPSNLPQGELPKQKANSSFFWESLAKHTLKDWGFTEIHTYSLISKKDLKRVSLDPQNALPLKNPLGKQWAFMRPSLIPSMLAALSQNLAHRLSLSLFEIANIYLPKNHDLPQEKPVLCLAQTGNRYLRLKGTLEALFQELKIQNIQFLRAESPSLIFHPSRTAQIVHHKAIVGILGQIHPKITDDFNIKGRVILSHLDFGLLTTVASTRQTFEPLPKFPPVIEDLSFNVKPQTYIAPLIEEIKKTDPLIKKVTLFDSYQNTRTFRLIYQSKKGPLTTTGVSIIRKKIIQNLKKLHITLKS